ncbi:MAG TPA: hypothetical protein VJ793_05715 [Anaerolineae bacterium]|nr:hypothetical protein [Anaerolineae bacterium]
MSATPEPLDPIAACLAIAHARGAAWRAVLDALADLGRAVQVERAQAEAQRDELDDALGVDKSMEADVAAVGRRERHEHV